MADAPVDQPYNIGRSLRGMPQPTRSTGSGQARGRKNVRKLVGGFDREKDDFYPTPPALTRPLLRLERLGEADGCAVWECACGDGAIVRVLEEFGYEVVATDLVARGAYTTGGRDFLMEQRLLAPVVFTNPPFKLWLKFVDHALHLGAAKVVMLGRVLNLEGKAAAAFMQANGLARVYVSAGRVDILPPGANPTGKGGIIAYAWYVFERGWQGAPTLHWITPDKASPAGGSACSAAKAREPAPK